MTATTHIPQGSTNLQSQVFFLNNAVNTLESQYSTIVHNYHDLYLAAEGGDDLLLSQHQKRCEVVLFQMELFAEIPHIFGWLKANSSHVWSAIQQGNLNGAGYGLWLGSEKVQDAEWRVQALTAAMERHCTYYRELKLQQQLPAFYRTLADIQEQRAYLERPYASLEEPVPGTPLVTVEAMSRCHMEFGGDFGTDTPCDAAVRELSTVVTEFFNRSEDVADAEHVFQLAEGRIEETRVYLQELEETLNTLHQVQQWMADFQARELQGRLGNGIVESPLEMSASPTIGMDGHAGLDSMPTIPAYNDFRYSTPRLTPSKHQNFPALPTSADSNTERIQVWLEDIEGESNQPSRKHSEFLFPDPTTALSTIEPARHPFHDWLDSSIVEGYRPLGPPTIVEPIKLDQRFLPLPANSNPTNAKNDPQPQPPHPTPTEFHLVAPPSSTALHHPKPISPPSTRNSMDKWTPEKIEQAELYAQIEAQLLDLLKDDDRENFFW